MPHHRATRFPPSSPTPVERGAPFGVSITQFVVQTFPRAPWFPDSTLMGSTPEVNDRPIETILFVDENTAIRRVAQQGLSRRGYRVLLAESGTRALQTLLLHQGRIDVVISNVVIPRLEATTRFLFTGAGLGDAALSALRSRPGTAYLAKPWRIGELVREINALSGRAD